jgi:hypothetical protein
VRSIFVGSGLAGGATAANILSLWSGRSGIHPKPWELIFFMNKFFDLKFKNYKATITGWIRKYKGYKAVA